MNGVLLDLAGIAYKESRVIPGPLAAIGRLRSSKIPGRFMTSTTRLSKNEMLRTLKEIGLSIESDEPFTPIDAARNWLVANGAIPHLLVHPAIADEFSGPPKGTRKAVVVGDAGTGFDYRGLNTAFRSLVEGAELIPLGKNRSFRDDDGQFSLDGGRSLRL
jgi:ribonucleotide monophosphatase NagD (HAD superfamily)